MPIPPGARVFAYPCAETLGVIWAFNGEAPDFPPPAVRDFAPAELLVRARRAHVFSVAPWISVGNTFDFLHLRHVHGLAFDFDPGREIRWIGAHEAEYEIEFASPQLGRFGQRIRVSGPNVVSYVTPSTGATASATCPTSPMADADKCEWAKLIAGSNETIGGVASSVLPDARGCVFQIDAPSRTYAVAIAWRGTNPTVAPNTATYAAMTCGQNAYANENLRRVVAMPLVIGTLN